MSFLPFKQKNISPFKCNNINNNSQKKDDQYIHLFYKKKGENKPPLHAKSFNEDFEEKTIKNKKKDESNEKNLHKKNSSSFDYRDSTAHPKKNEYDFLKKKTQMILNDLHRMKSKSNHIKTEIYEDSSAKIKNKVKNYKDDSHKNNKTINFSSPEKDELSHTFQKAHRLKRNNDEIQSNAPLNEFQTKKQALLEKTNDFKFKKRNESVSSSEEKIMETKENRSFYSNMTGNYKEPKVNNVLSTHDNWSKNKKDIEMLSSIHEKDLEIIELKNRITKFEIESKSYESTTNRLNATNEKYKQEISKLQQEKILKDKEIEYLKVCFFKKT